MDWSMLSVDLKYIGMAYVLHACQKMVTSLLTLSSGMLAASPCYFLAFCRHSCVQVCTLDSRVIYKSQNMPFVAQTGHAR